MNKIIALLIILSNFILLCHTYSINPSNTLKKRDSESDTFNFRVISLTENKYDVYLFYEGEKYLMEEYIYPLYIYKMPKDKIVSTDEIKYHFGVFEKNDKNDNVIDEEDFQRIFSYGTSDQNTYNHIFKNEKDFYEYKRIPRVYEKFNYTQPSELFDDRFVSTIIFELDDKNSHILNEYHNNPNNSTEAVSANMIYISPYAIKKFKNVSLNISGDRSLYNKKLSYKVTDIEGINGNGLYNRKALKLRANQDDASYIREKLVYSLADSLGIPTQGCTFTRVIINKKNIGLFSLIDHISNYNFLKQVFNNGESFNKNDDGLLYKIDNQKGGINGNMMYYDDDPENHLYNAYVLKKSTYCKKNDISVSDREKEVKEKQLIPLFKTINALTNENAGNFEKNTFDVETYLRSLVLDYLCQGVDNYLFWGDNYYLFKNANKKANDYRWFFVSTDFHFTFGSDGYTHQIKDTFYNQSAHNPEMDTTRHPLTKLLEVDNASYSARINEIIKTVIEKAFNPYFLFSYIDSIVDMIDNDVKWDLLLEKVNPNGKASEKMNYDLFTQNVKDKENLNIVPLPLKAFINIRAKNSAKEVNAILPSFENNNVTVENYIEPKYASAFVEEESSSGFSITIKNNINIINTIILTLFVILFVKYY
jgi:hypothetical protein